MNIVGIFLGKTSAPDIGKFQHALDSFMESYEFKIIYLSRNCSYDVERLVNDVARKNAIRTRPITFPSLKSEEDLQKFVNEFANDISQSRLPPIILTCGSMNAHENAILNYAINNGVMNVDLMQ